MEASTAPTIFAHFAALEDPRLERTTLQPLLSLVAIALCGVICGADAWVEVAEFGDLRREWLALPGDIHSHDTFGRVFAALDPEAFGACVADWVRAVASLPTLPARPFLAVQRVIRRRVERSTSLEPCLTRTDGRGDSGR